MTNSMSEIKGADCILVIGSNTTAAHPVIAYDIKKAVRNGAKLIIANPRKIDLCDYAHLWIRHSPGSDVALLMGMMKVILDEELAELNFISECCDNFDAFKESLKNFDLDFAEKATGVPRNTIIEAARLYATHKPATIVYAMGITQHSHGVDNVLAVANLAMLTGNMGKPSTGVNPLRGQNNVQGSCDMGALPDVYTGYQKVDDPVANKKFSEAWGCQLPAKPGFKEPQMYREALSGKLKAMNIIGYDPAATQANIHHVQSAM